MQNAFINTLYLQKRAKHAKPVMMSVTLNGGKRKLETATIPIKWWLANDLIKKNPTHILFFEQEKDTDKWDCDSRGYRYICKSTDTVKFLQLFSPGIHRIMVLSLHANVDDVNLFMKTHHLYNYCIEYSRSLNWADAERNSLEDIRVLASTVEEFEIPKELFAERSETKFGKLVWKWVNYLYDKKPSDQCDYRKRKIIAFTIQPPLVALWLIVKHLIGGTVYSLYILVASLTVLHFGYRPRPIIKEMYKAFIFSRYAEWEVRQFEYAEDGDSRGNYRLWSVNKNGSKRAYTYMPLAPWTVTLSIALIIGFIFIFSLSPIIFIYSATGVTISTLLMWLILRWLTKTEKTRRLSREELLQEWLKENALLDKKTESIDITKLPTPQGLKNRIKNKFYVGFWTFKTKVCRPFSRS